MTTQSRRAAGLTIAWMVVAAAMATFAWQAVSAAGTSVNQQPLYPLSAGVPVLQPDPAADVVVVPLETSTTSTTGSTSASTTLPDEVTSSTSSTTSTPGTSTTSSTATSTTSTTAATTTSSTSTTSTTAAAVKRASYTMIGGTITIEYGNGEVVLISAVPKAGFATEIDSSGPSEVDVDFRSETHRSKFDASMSNGELVVSTEEKVDD